jgi:hypothetical protein
MCVEKCFDCDKACIKQREAMGSIIFGIKCSIDPDLIETYFGNLASAFQLSYVSYK